ncbi:MAG: SIMPL domain-containing protein [Dermatophilaceae bacterium]
MTVTITPRRAALVTLAVIALIAVYVLGAARSGGAPAAASAFTNTSNTSSTQPLSTRPSAALAVGSPGIIVGGRAKVAGTPDTLRLDLSVVATASSVSEALASANRSAAAVQKSLLDSFVQKKDLQTSGLNIAPEYDYSNNAAPRLKGYQVSESISARLRDLGRAGDAIGKAVDAGGNAVRVNGISLDLEDTGALVSSARDKAFADAKAKAEQYAKAAGRSLGDVISISEDVTTPSPIPMPYAAAGTTAKDLASVPIQPGSQDVSVSVTVVFAMR